MTERPFSCEHNNTRFQLRRITNRKDEYDIFQRSLCIKDDYGALYRLTKRLEQKEKRLLFSELYACLKMLFGESSSTFDDFKSSFSFAFYLDVIRDDATYPYFLSIYNCRDSLYFSFRRILDHDDEILQSDKRHVVHDPICHELSGESMEWFINFFYFYLVGYFSQTRHLWTEEFIKTVPSQLIIFGYRDGEFFEQHCEDADEYETART